MVIVQKRTDVRKDGLGNEEDALVQHQIQRNSVRKSESIPKQLRLQYRWVVAHIPDGISDKDRETESLVLPPQKECC